MYQTGKYEKLEASLRQDIAVGRNLVVIQTHEISLLPRPVKLYAEVVDASERMLYALEEIRTLRFSVPRKATVLDVLPIRRELVSPTI